MALPATQNLGRFKFNADLINGIRSPELFEGCPECLRHGRRGYLKIKAGKFGQFLGCVEWPVCNYTR
jgi:ssDNA-binding Zn-finger/Zn-ribbon topoisomerase 1